MRAHTEELVRYVVPQSAPTKPSSSASLWPMPAPPSPTSRRRIQPARRWLESSPAPLTSLAWISRPRYCRNSASQFRSGSTRMETLPSDSHGMVRPALRSIPTAPRLGLFKPGPVVSTVYVFDMRSVAWADIAPLFTLPLAIFNAVFEVKRLIHEAGIEPTGRIYDVMTAIWLTDGRRPSLAEAIAINYKITLPKELGASDWSSDILTAEQLEYAALDAVLCRLLWNTQQNELFDDIDKQCQEVVDAVTPAIARMELHGMPIDVDAHRAQIARWQTELAAAEKALRHASPPRDLRKPAELQAHLNDVLDAESLSCVAAHRYRQVDDPASTTATQYSPSSARRAAAGSWAAEADRCIWRESDRGDQPCNRTTPHQFSYRRRQIRTLLRSWTEPAAMPKQREAGFRKIFAAPAGTAGDGAGLQPDRAARRR